MPQVTPGYSLFAQHTADHGFPHMCRIATVGKSARDYDTNGQAILKDEREVKCRIEPLTSRTVGDNGDIITMSGLKVTVPWLDPVSAEDRIFLPAPWEGYGPIILSVIAKYNAFGMPSNKEITIV